MRWTRLDGRSITMMPHSRPSYGSILHSRPHYGSNRPNVCKSAPLKTSLLLSSPGHFMVPTAANLWEESHAETYVCSPFHFRLLPLIKRDNNSGILGAGAHHLRRTSTTLREAGNGNHRRSNEGKRNLRREL